MIFWVLVVCRALLHSQIKTAKLAAAAGGMALGQCGLLLLPAGGAAVKLLIGYPLLTLLGLGRLFRPPDGGCLLKLSAAAYAAALLMGASLMQMERWMGGSVLFFLLLPVMAGGMAVGLYLLLRLIESYGSVSIAEVELFFTETESCRFTALWDTGNGLREPVGGQPVSLIEEEAIAPYLSLLRPESCRLVPYHSIGCKKGILTSFIIEQMKIAREGEWICIPHPVIGITKEKISGKGGYRMILHPELTDRRIDR